MVAQAHEAVHPLNPCPSRVVAQPPAAIRKVPARAAPGRIETIVRRVTAIAALAWLGYVGYLLRGCPASGAICRTSNFAISAAVMALGLVLLGHLAGRLASILDARWHRPSAG